MRTEIKFTVELEPVPMSRPKINTATRQAFYPARYKNFKDALSLIAKSVMKGRKPLTDKIKITLDLYRNKKIDSKSFGDVDNHQKAIFDALNGICFTDDCQIVSVTCNKHKDKFQRIEIKIEEVKQWI